MEENQKYRLLLAAMLAGVFLPVRKSHHTDLDVEEEHLDGLIIDAIQRNGLVNAWNETHGLTIDEIPLDYVDYAELQRRLSPVPGSEAELEEYNRDIEAAKALLTNAGYALGQWQADAVWNEGQSDEAIALPEDFSTDEALEILDSALNDEGVCASVNNLINDALRERYPSGKEADDED